MKSLILGTFVLIFSAQLFAKDVRPPNMPKNCVKVKGGWQCSVLSKAEEQAAIAKDNAEGEKNRGKGLMPWD